MVNFTGLINTSQRLIQDVGRLVSIERNVSVTDVDPSKPWLGKTSSIELHPAYAAFINFEEKDIDGTLIRAGDQRCLISPKNLTIEISTSDKIIDGTTTWTIVQAKSQQPGNTVLIYNLQVRS